MKELDKTKEKSVAKKRVAELQMSEAQHKRKERRIQEAREYFEGIVNTVREPLIILDQDLRVITAGRSFYDVFKVRPEETVGQFIYDLGNKQWDIPGLRELLEIILPQKKTLDDYEVEHVFTAIGKRTMLLNARQIQRLLGKEQLILLAIEDITERKRLEDLLMESEERYRRLFETASDGIVLLEKREGKITHANTAAGKMLGYSLEESVGKKLQDIGMVDIDDFQTTMQELNKMGIVHYTDVSIETKSGEHINTDIYLVDKSMSVQCNIRDTSERNRAEKLLLNSEEKHRLLFDGAGDAIFVADSEARMLSVNSLACARLGYTHAELMSMTVYQVDSPAEAPNAPDRIAQLMEHGHLTFETVHKCKDGSLIPTEVSARRITWDGQPAIMSICRDITSRKLAEEKLKQTLEKLRKNLVGTIHALSSTVEARDPYTSGHQTRVSNLARVIAQEMGLPNDAVDTIRMAGSIHDIGKISIPAEILSKPGKLSNVEFSLVKVHPQSGYYIIKDTGLPYPIAEIILQHHERLDGSGYPQGLKDGQILLESQIISVADVVEAMVSHRPYRAALGIDVALEEIEKHKGILYDADAVDACLKLFREKGFKFETTT